MSIHLPLWWFHKHDMTWFIFFVAGSNLEPH
jgi:hypothetical protein